MRYSIIFISLLILSACDNLITHSMQKTDGVGIALQSYTATCCGSCGQSVVIDSLNGIQHVLHIECDFQNGCCRSCLFGTEKFIYRYSKKYIVEQSRYKPVYDTVALKKRFPTINRSAYFDSALLQNATMPLTTTDSLLISRALKGTTASNCDKTYLSLITGFVFLKSEQVKYKKFVRFKTEK